MGIIEFDPIKPRVNVAGLGDVGSNLTLGLRLLGGNIINSIGVFDLDESKVKRFYSEFNQIGGVSWPSMPPVCAVGMDSVFDCDVFVFSVASAVPPVGSDSTDVRKVQFEANSRILASYIEIAKARSFSGIFAIVSDPVDELCDFADSLFNDPSYSSRIKGFGLGVMYERALFIAREMGSDPSLTDVFGPHGRGLIVVNSTDEAEYDETLSMELTERTVTFNMVMRGWGYKPFIAPALSSGAISILSMLKGEYFHSTMATGCGHLGIRNRLVSSVEKGIFQAFPYNLKGRPAERLISLNPSSEALIHG
jgi:hypothetical protein